MEGLDVCACRHCLDSGEKEEDAEEDRAHVRMGIRVSIVKFASFPCRRVAGGLNLTCAIAEQS
jgi:hypothetical protein